MRQDYSLIVKSHRFSNIYALNGPILVTGHTGFKGAWLSLLLKALEIPFVGLSLQPKPESLYLRAGLRGAQPEEFIDIRDSAKVEKSFERFQPSAVIHLAAQPLVLESYRSPQETFDTNVMGTINVLEASFQCDTVRSFLGVTTDKVYRNDNSGRRFKENDPLGGKDPYSASKVGTESALEAWRQISRINSGPQVLSLRAGNVIGGGDLAENRIIPDIVRAISTEEKAVIRNRGSSRPWQHALDPLFGYLLALENSIQFPNSDYQIFNFGPDDKSKRVIDVVNVFQKVFSDKLILDLPERIQSDLESVNLDLDSTLAKSEFRWNPTWSQDEAIENTAIWWKKVLLENVSAHDACLSDIEAFLETH